MSHPAFEKVVELVDSAFDLATTADLYWWKAETRDELVRAIAGRIPELDGGYHLKHMVRSFASVFKLSDITCHVKFYNMSKHNNAAITLLEKAKVTPSMIIEGLRALCDLGSVNTSLLRNDDMLLELCICSTWTIFIKILNDELPVYDLQELSNFDALKEIYFGEFSEHVGGGIAHASSGAYSMLKGKLKPVSPPQLPDDTARAQWFLRLMKALLLSRVIAKSPLENANDIGGLSRAKDAFEAKGYKGKELIKLLIITHRLWTPKRMGQFVSSIPAAAATTTPTAAATGVAAAAPRTAAAAPRVGTSRS